MYNKPKYKKIISAFAVIAVLFLILTSQSSFAAIKPGTVKLTKISASANDKVTINWKAASNATHYKIYYRKSGTTKWTCVATISNSKTSYTHKSSTKYPISSGKKYDYTVRGYNSVYKTSGKYNTNGLTVKTPGTVKLIAVSHESDSTTGEYNSVEIYWKKNSGFDKYRIYRKTPSDSKWKLIDITEGSIATYHSQDCLAYFDEHPVKGVENTYTVRGYNSTKKQYSGYNTKGISVFVKAEGYIQLKYFSLFSQDTMGSNVHEVWKKDGTFKIPIICTPENATIKSIEWRSSDPSVLSVDSNGYATPLKAGKTTVSAKTSEGLSASTYVYVYDEEGMIEQAIEYANQKRIENGIAPFKTHPLIQEMAMIRANDLTTKFSHERPNGNDGLEVASLVGCANASGENIAAGCDTGKEAIDVWMNSTGHRVALLNHNYTYVGIGIAYKKSNNCFYWSMNFTTGDPDEKATITLNTMGGDYLEPVNAPRKTAFKAYQLPTPTKSGYIFDGWYWDEACTTKFTGTKKIGNDTFYAKWIKN